MQILLCDPEAASIPPASVISLTVLLHLFGELSSRRAKAALLAQGGAVLWSLGFALLLFRPSDTQRLEARARQCLHWRSLDCVQVEKKVDVVCQDPEPRHRFQKLEDAFVGQRHFTI